MARKKKSKSSKNKNQKLNKEILGLIIIAFGIFSLLSISETTGAGAIGEFIKRQMDNLVGDGSFIIPFVIIIVGVLLLINKLNIKENKKITLITVLYLNYLTLLSIKDINDGGIIGYILASINSTLLGEIGSYIIIYFISLICILLLTNISLVKLIKLISRKIYRIFYICCKTIKEFLYVNDDKNILKTSKVNKTKFEDELIISDNIDAKIKILDYTKNEELKNQDTINKNVEEVTDKNFKNSSNDIGSLNLNNERSNFSEYVNPSLELLVKGNNNYNEVEKKVILEKAKKLEYILSSFGIKADVKQISKGPSITRFELEPAPGVKVSKILNLSNDIALGLAASDVRIEAPIPGKAAIGIEVPNDNKVMVRLRDVLESKEYQESKSTLAIALGKDIAGKTIVANIDVMPHLLIAGATGSGKSVCINTLITSILFRAKPNEVKLLMIDPKVVELSVYNGIPHLLTPVVTDPKKAAGALNWAVQEMTRRYSLFADKSVRDLKSYNNKIQKEGTSEKLPQIVLIIDELADLMMVSPTEVEDSICRIAQMARAAGIHLIVATQRPSVDVITGTIKANIPSRLSFAVSSQADSRTILDMGGAEKLLGKGDMLFYPVGESKPKRIQGAYMDDLEVEKIVEFLKKQSYAIYEEEIINEISKEVEENYTDVDELFQKAVELVIDEGQASVSYLQRKLKIGYSRAARIMDQMEEQGVVGSREGSKPRKVLVTRDSNI